MDRPDPTVVIGDPIAQPVVAKQAKGVCGELFVRSPSSPSRPWRTYVATPDHELATTGTPVARASRAAMPNDSRCAGARKTAAFPEQLPDR